MRIPELVRLPESTMITLLPMEAICCRIRSSAPEPTATMAITAATPMMIPSIVSAERSLLIRSASKAMLMLWMSFFMNATSPPAARSSRAA